MTKKTNFTLACHWAFPKDQGGIGMHNIYLLQILQNYFHVSIVSSSNKLNNEYYSNRNIVFNSFELNYPKVLLKIMGKGYLNNGFRSLNDILTSYKISKILKKDNVDIIEFIDIHSDGYVYLKNKNSQNKTKVVIRSHTPWALLRGYYKSHEIKKTDTWWAIKREKYCFKNCDQITVPSNDLKAKLVDIFNLTDLDVKVLPNILDTDHFVPMECKNDENFTILHLGRFERAKGVETLIKAFINIAKVYKNIRLINVGESRGPSKERCIKWLNAAGLIDRVTFTGFVHYKDLPQHYGNADIVVVPSEIYESFSYTVAQAMACGKPVVASNIGGISETLDNGNAGLLFEPGNIDELFTNIELLYSDISARESYGQKAREYSVRKFSFQALGTSYNKFYRSILL
tara:strand:+ start:6966 stop:8168 length:1203 start_codon:yes stop_codon:yes gene_type:complete